MGIISRGILNPELEARIFAAKEGSLPGPVKEENGWHYIRRAE
jgi:parvulin-like peptidyl-prolyl isomerase